MNANPLASGMETVEDEPVPTRLEQWRIRARSRLLKWRAPALRVALFALGVVAAFVALLLYQTFFPGPRPLTTGDVKTSIAQAFASATPQPAFSEQVYQAIQPSLVLIEASVPGANGAEEQDLGTGVVIDDQGDIMTALHVVTQSTSITLTFADGTSSSGQISTAQPENDIALLTADHPPAQIAAATLGNPGSMRVGDEAFVVGNPFGLYASMSSGVISGFGRSIQPVGSNTTLKNLIQIDAAVNPGNSGGPLLNRNGDVIGIVTGLANPTDQNFFVGIGFAVPITVATTSNGAPPPY